MKRAEKDKLSSVRRRGAPRHPLAKKVSRDGEIEIEGHWICSSAAAETSGIQDKELFWFDSASEIDLTCETLNAITE